ncbi:MAG: hypothetical protein C5B47_03120 [Verrucomicrobia bacterium]|nr:MAG: hypothetical protein C5B47_03120 [Verrucomicrobiota bacterium]
MFKKEIKFMLTSVKPKPVDLNYSTVTTEDPEAKTSEVNKFKNKSVSNNVSLRTHQSENNNSTQEESFSSLSQSPPKRIEAKEDGLQQQPTSSVKELKSEAAYSVFEDMFESIQSCYADPKIDPAKSHDRAMDTKEMGKQILNKLAYKDPAEKYFLYYLNEKPVGMLACNSIYHKTYDVALVVHPEISGVREKHPASDGVGEISGVREKLIEKAMQAIQECGAIQLHVKPTNIVSRRPFKALGFVLQENNDTMILDPRRHPDIWTQDDQGLYHLKEYATAARKNGPCN